MLFLERIDNTRPHKGYVTLHFSNKVCAIIYWYTKSVRFYDFKINKEPETVDFDIVLTVSEMLK